MALPSFSSPTVGQSLSLLILSDDNGGKVSGGNWSSQDTKGYTTVLFYVDPDESTTNDHVSEALKNEHFPKETFKSVAIINLAASWIPNAIINSKLKDKQQEFPHTTYVKDLKKILVKAWGFADDNNTVALIGKDGTLLFYKSGKLSGEDVKKLITLISADL